MTSLEEVKEKIQDCNKDHSQKIIEFLEDEKNARYLQILTSVYDVDRAFKEFVNILAKKSASYRPPVNSKNNERLVEADKIFEKDASTKSKGFELTNKGIALIRIVFMFLGTLFGTAILPGIGTVFGAIFGEHISTYARAHMVREEDRCFY